MNYPMRIVVSKIGTLIKLCLSKFFFILGRENYQSKNSGPIGLTLMVFMAEGFLQHHEKAAISIALSLQPPVASKLFLRYIDDGHVRYGTIKQAEEFKEILNQQFPNHGSWKTRKDSPVPRSKHNQHKCRIYLQNSQKERHHERTGEASLWTQS